MNKNDVQISKKSDSKEVHDAVQAKIDSQVLNCEDFDALIVFGFKKDNHLVSIQKADDGEQLFNLLMNAFDSIKEAGGEANLRMIARCAMLIMTGVGSDNE